MGEDILKVLTDHLAKIPRHLRQRHTGILIAEAAERIKELQDRVQELEGILQIRHDEPKKRE